MNVNINKLSNVTIIGTGAWGTAIAKVLSESNNIVTMYGINKREINEINKYGTNKTYFPNHKLKTIIRATDDLSLALKNANYVILAIPSEFLKKSLLEIKKKLKHKVIFVNLIKGIDPKTKKPWSFTISKIMHEKSLGLASLIGPSFAKDVFMQKPTIVNITSDNMDVVKKIQEIFRVPYFKIVFCKDIIGSEVIAAYKNLLAIGIGMVSRKYNSINTLASIFTQGIKEIKIIVLQNGGKEDTILEYCGIGDIFLTCTSPMSRNYSFGENVYKKGIQKATLNNKSTIEGYTLFKVVKDDIFKNKKLPIFQLICKILNEELEPKNLINEYFDIISK